MKIKTITADETLSLRSEVLRSGKPLAQCVFEGDKGVTTRHFGAVDEKGIMVGVVSVYLKDNPLLKQTNTYQIRAMATAANYRGKGLGKALLSAAEDYAESQDAELIWANARSTAMGFYTNSGYKQASKEFIIPEIGPHFLVTKVL